MADDDKATKATKETSPNTCPGCGEQHAFAVMPAAECRENGYGQPPADATHVRVYICDASGDPIRIVSRASDEEAALVG